MINLPHYPTPPTNIMAFSRRFPDDASCADYLFQLRWPNGYACPKCGSTKAGRIRAVPGMMECENHHKISVTAGTSLHRTKLPLTLWFHAAWLLATLKPGISALQLQRQLGITRLETAWTMLHKLRGAMFAPQREKLSNACKGTTHTDHWIEVDEVLVGGRNRGKGHEHALENKTLVMVAVEVHAWFGYPDKRDLEAEGRERKRKPAAHTRAGRCRMRVVKDRKMGTLARFVRDNVADGQRIWTDDNPAYSLTQRYGYPRRITVAHAASDPLPTLGRVVTNLKRWLIGTHKGAVEGQHLQAYLNEYVFRFNRRDIPWVAFNRALGLAAMDRAAVEYEGLYKHTWLHPNPTQGPDQYDLELEAEDAS